MIGAVKVGADTGGREGYPSAMSGVWSGLAIALQRLDVLASEPGSTLGHDDALESLRGFQYVLHAARETAEGVSPPAGNEALHTELVGALADARDLTAEVHEVALNDGPEAASLLAYEWRGALFRVRLAQLRLASAGPGEPGAGEPPRGRRFERGAAAGTLLVLAGTVAVAAGATLALWPVWAAGLALIAAAIVALRAL